MNLAHGPGNTFFRNRSPPSVRLESTREIGLIPFSSPDVVGPPRHLSPWEGRVNMRQQAVLVLCWLAIFGNVLMLPAATSVGNRALLVLRDAHHSVIGAYLWLFFAAYLGIVALLSLGCACILRARTLEATRAGSATGASSSVNCRHAIFGNLFTLPVAVVSAACTPAMGFGGLASVVAVASVSLACGLILRDLQRRGQTPNR